MRENIIGREEEKRLLGDIFASGRSEFVAVCGRRRVGKTFLIKEFFEQELVFQTAGLADENSRRQIKSFYDDMLEQGLPRQAEPPRDWIDIFSLLRQLIKLSDRQRKVVLLDELPWMDTPRSGFVSSLEHFWNAWASSRRDVILIVCGSATSWMMDKLINNHGGLHNRLTHRIFLQPFTLRETEAMLQRKGFTLSRYDVCICYMVMGGIPYYLDLLDARLSVAQNIDNLMFRPNGQLAGEFHNLYAALFRNSTDYVNIVEALSKRKEGLTRGEIIRATGLSSGNGITTTLRNLEACGFIRHYHHFHGSRDEAVIYQLTDFFSLFHFHFLAKGKVGSWMALQGTAAFFAWAGLTFELVAWHHLQQIKDALGIGGVRTEEFVWRCTDAERGAQIDLVVDRADQTINICEMKFCQDTFTISADYEANLRHKLSLFAEYTRMRKSLQLTLVTTYGLGTGSHRGAVSNVVTLDELFT